MTAAILRMLFRLIGREAPQSLADDLHGAAVRLIRGLEPAWPAWSPARREVRVLDVDGGDQDESLAAIEELLG